MRLVLRVQRRIRRGRRHEALELQAEERGEEAHACGEGGAAELRVERDVVRQHTSSRRHARQQGIHGLWPVSLGSRALQSNSIVSEQESFTWKESAMLCLESALKPLVFDDDLVDVLLSLELLARCAALHVVASGLSGGQLFNDDIFTAALVAIAVAGPLSKNDAVSERLLNTLKLFVQDALSGASSLSDKTLFEQFTNMLKDANVTEVGQEANETVFIAAKAAMSSLVENVGLSVNATEVSNNRLSLLKTAFSNSKK